jgi:hypothetical protein
LSCRRQGCNTRKDILTTTRAGGTEHLHRPAIFTQAHHTTGVSCLHQAVGVEALLRAYAAFSTSIYIITGALVSPFCKPTIPLFGAASSATSTSILASQFCRRRWLFYPTPSTQTKAPDKSSQALYSHQFITPAICMRRGFPLLALSMVIASGSLNTQWSQSSYRVETFNNQPKCFISM